MYNFMLSVARFFVAETSSATESGLVGIGNSLVSKVKSIMGIVMPIVFSIVTVLGVAYSVVLGINYAKAEDSEKREEAKKRLTGAVIGFGIAIVLSALIWGLSQIDSLWQNLFKTN